MEKNLTELIEIAEQPILIGGLQEHQSVKLDGICTTLSASMGMGGGYVPIIITKNEVNDL